MKRKNQIVKIKEKTTEDKQKIDELDQIIGKECEDKEIEKLQSVLGSLESLAGHTNNTNVWKQMKKAFPSKTRPNPTGVLNIEGKVITNPKEKKNYNSKTF